MSALSNKSKSTANLNADSKKQFASPQIKKRVVDDNIRGKKIEPITAELLNPQTNGYASTYKSEIAKSKSHAGLPIMKNVSQSQTLLSQNQDQSDRKDIQQRMAQTTQSIDVKSNFETPEKHRMEKSMSQTHRSLGFDGTHPDAAPLNKIINENMDFFKHMAGQCECGKCRCGKCKCKNVFLKPLKKSTWISLYAKDFPEYKLNEVPPKLKMDFQSTFKSNVPGDWGTINRNDFKNWDEKPMKLVDDRKTIFNVPFAGQSYYKSEFPNWGPNASNIQPPLIGKTVIPELPFFKDTTYGVGFANPSKTNAILGEKDPYVNKSTPIKPKTNRSPLSPGIPFLGESIFMKDFKPFRVKGNKEFKSKEDFHPTETYGGHFVSHYGEQFLRPAEEHLQCMSKKPRVKDTVEISG